MELEDWVSSDSEVSLPDSDEEEHSYANSDFPKLQFRFLAEIGALRLLDDADKYISLEDIYKKVAEGVGGSCYESFEVYRHLKSLGYIVKRHHVCWSMKRENGNENRGYITEITELFSTMKINVVRPVFNVYPPNSKFRKSNPGNPMFILCVSSGNPPTKKQIEDLEGQCDGIPLKFCYVEHGRVGPDPPSCTLNSPLIGGVLELYSLDEELFVLDIIDLITGPICTSC